MTTDGTTTTAAPGAMLAAHVRGYAEAVRLHLADLGPEVTEDLTGGLEADLAEAVADAVPVAHADHGDDVVLDLAAYFGPAEAYASELRSAAGLPPAGPPRRHGVGALAAAARWWAGRRDQWTALLEPVVSTRPWAMVRGVARDLRPVWWVARGWLVAMLVIAWFGQDYVGVLPTSGPVGLVPTDRTQLVVLAVGALVSFQWGRGRWLPTSWRLPVVGATSALAMLLLPAALGETKTQILYGALDDGGFAAGYQAGRADGEDVAQAVAYGGVPGDDGVWVDGMQVSNLFAFDADGDPIKDVQLYDDRGRPVRTVSEEVTYESWEVPQTEGPWYFQPAVAADGRERWNTYPLRASRESDMEWPTAGPPQPAVGAQPETMPWPFLKAPVEIEPDGGAPDEPAAADGEGSPAPAPSGDPAGPADDGATHAPPSDTEDARFPSPEPTTNGGATTVLDASPQR
ncbi:hypothetical protein UQW22_09795 [Isoptericola halotolerans]|uniref:hypothetical protein n=1 Tax=Isoptericola halotolerans TaxID=300560 RepID=UPI00388EBB7E